MQGRIIELKDGEVYLEVDEQLRFRTKYIAPQTLSSLSVLDRIDFTFLPDIHSPCIEIRSVCQHSDLSAHGLS